MINSRNIIFKLLTHFNLKYEEMDQPYYKFLEEKIDECAEDIFIIGDSANRDLTYWYGQEEDHYKTGYLLVIPRRINRNQTTYCVAKPITWETFEKIHALARIWVTKYDL